MTFGILFVCTGNICRSPVAEFTARSLFDRKLGAAARQFSVASAGTWGHEGSRMEPEALHALAAAGIDGSSFRARELTSEMVDGAALILTATGEHAVAAGAFGRDAAQRIFAMTEFTRLLASIDVARLPSDIVERARHTVAAAHLVRTSTTPRRPDADVADPYGAPQRVFAKTASHIESLLEPFAALLGRQAPATPGSSPIARAGILQP
ncbi:MAG: Tyrosine phosphatase [Frankiales bacterium]|nr:Tyrosine phosphatase [Frankiales bacterium]